MPTTRVVSPADSAVASDAVRGFDDDVATLAIRLAEAPLDAATEAITETLRAINARLELDWAVVWAHDTDASPRALYHAVRERLPSLEVLAELLTNARVRARLAAGEPVWCSRRPDLIGLLGSSCGETHWPSELRSTGFVPMVLPAGASRATLVVGSSTREVAWTSASITELRLIAAMIGQALTRKSEAQALKVAQEELRSLRTRSTVRAVQPRARANHPHSWGLIASDSTAVRQALAQVEQVAQTASTALLLGETGVGKEHFAAAIHELSDRGGREMVRVSCAAIPSTLIESELFGRERGAYTGALTRQIGRFEAANGSTLFLDEIGELSADVQAKLLRALETRVIERLGSTQPLSMDVRIIAATHRNLEKAVADGTFREDLFYRLNVFPIVIPPLRDRLDDIPRLAWRFTSEFSDAIGKPVHSIAEESMRQLMAYSWPGNIRELRNVIERAVILTREPVLTIPMPQGPVGRPAQLSARLADVETAHIRSVLESTAWRIRGKGGASERLGLKPSTLETRMAKLGLVRPRAT